MKILEAMAAGTPVVSTSVGVEGLGVKNGREVVICNQPTEMAEAARKASERGVGIYAMKVLGQGFDLVDHTVEEMLGHVLAMPFVHALAVGMNRIPELEQDVEIVERLDSTR